MLRLTILLIALSTSAVAATTADVQEQLSGTLSELKDSNKKQQDISKKKASLEKEMKALQQETVDIARDAKKQEEALNSLEEKEAILEAQKKEKSEALEKRRGELSETLAAMVKLSALPPEAVIAMPGKIQETLSAARALGVITQAVEDESRSLKEQIFELDQLEQKIAKNRQDLVEKQRSVAVRQKELARKMEAREKMHVSLHGKAREEKERLAKLTERSKNLQDLVETLEKNDVQEEKEPEVEERNPSPASVRLHLPLDKNTPGKSKKTKKQRAISDAKGRLGMPASGRIVNRFGSSNAGAAFAKGVTVETRDSANVVAPYDGEVVYAGVFRDYGKMVIIRHSGDYHTLLSGLSEINCSPGQHLLEGEPIGAMGKPAEGGKPRLYIEMRRSGKPIDPMAWFRG